MDYGFAIGKQPLDGQVEANFFSANCRGFWVEPCYLAQDQKWLGAIESHRTGGLFTNEGPSQSWKRSCGNRELAKSDWLEVKSILEAIIPSRMPRTRQGGDVIKQIAERNTKPQKCPTSSESSRPCPVNQTRAEAL